MEKSVHRVTVWHHEACRVMSGCRPEGLFFYLSNTPMTGSFSCIPFISESEFLIMQSFRLQMFFFFFFF